MAYTMAFAADLVPTDTNEQYFIAGNVEHLVGDALLEYLRGVDFTCFNLETPLTTESWTARYPGPYLKARPETVNGIRALKPSLVTIGNNHLMDHGPAGCLETMETLRSAGIPFSGAGRDLAEATQPWCFEAEGMHIGVYNCTEYEFAAAGENRCGASPYDPLISFDRVAELKQRCDFVVVLYHGGKEFYRYPSPQLQRVCRKFVEKGASVVLCQHTHCIGCSEEYLEGHIVYGQGNFLFDRKETEFKKTGVIVECTLEAGELRSVRFVPFVKQAECVRMADREDAKAILDAMQARSREIQEPGFIDAHYRSFALEKYSEYIGKLVGGNKWLRRLDRLTGGRLTKHMYTQKGALVLLNMISPENHEECLKTALRIYGEG